MKSIYSDITWGKVQEKKEKGKLEEYRYSDKNGIVVYRYIKKYIDDIEGKSYYDIFSYRGAAGPYIETVVSGCEKELVTAFHKEFALYCKENGIVAEFAKLDPWNEFCDLFIEVNGAEYYGNFYCNNLEKDFYKEEYNRRSKRAIKKAINGGVSVEFDFNGTTIKDFVRLYKNTEEKYNTSDYYNMDEEDIREYFDNFKDNAFLINAIYEDEIITSVLVVMGTDIMHYFLLGNNPKYLELQANSLLTYEAALYGKKCGKKLFDMGGGVPGGNIELFKRNFIVDEGVWKYYAIKKIHNEEVYKYLVEKKGVINNTKFFPMYRG